VVGVVVGMLIAYFGWKNSVPWPGGLTWQSLSHDLDNFQTWLSDRRNVPHPSVFFVVFNGVATFLDDIVGWLTSFFFKLTWVGTAALGTAVVLRFGGRRAALGTAAAFVSFAALGVWEASMRTFALTFASVALSLAIGVPVGIAAGRSDRVQRAITPVLDAMQIIPAFAYLMPIVLLLSVGPGAAVATTLIYSIPPAIRITALGIRSVPTNTVEAAEAFGATRLQTLLKVQLPLARRLVLLAVNQTILFALSMVVIAGLIGGQGLGDVVTNGLYSDPALAILAGFTIVIMAIALDRATEAMPIRPTAISPPSTSVPSGSTPRRSPPWSGSRSASASRCTPAARGRARPRRTGCWRASRACSTTSRTRARSSSTSRIRSATSSSAGGSRRWTTSSCR